jgi:Family of unknown function (DUF5989)
MSHRPTDDFEKASAERTQDIGIVAEFFDFLKYNKKWWLLPIVAVLFLLGLFIVLSTTAAAPFIYTLF